MRPMAEDSAGLLQVLILLAATVLAIPLFRALKIAPVLGYLTAGIIVGPHVFGLIDDPEQMRSLGDFGVVFLLFTIGLEMKLSRLWSMRRLVFGLGSLQVLATGAALALLLRLWADMPVPVAVVLGGALALSSTAVVLQVLMERGELTSHAGRVAFAVLLMQDLAVVPLLLMVTALSGTGPSVPVMVGGAVLRAVLVGGAIVLAGRLLARPFLRMAACAHSAEAFAAAALLLVLGTALATEMAGLSMAMGAFMAGLLLAETEYRHQVEADIQPFRGFLLGLFFLSVGMGLDLPALLRHPLPILGLLAVLMAVKAAILAGLCLAFRLGAGLSLQSGLLLAQGGEFAFVLLAQSQAAGVVDGPAAGLGNLAVTASMMVTPFLAMAAGRLGARLSAKGADLGRLADCAGLSDHVIVAGFGRVGQTVVRLLRQAGIPHVALDLSSERVAAARGLGQAVYFADATRAEVLRSAGAERARAVVLTLDRPGASERAMARLHLNFPGLPVYARARDSDHGGTLKSAGAALAVPETVEASLHLGATVLRAAGLPREEVDMLMETIRRDDYAALRPMIRGEEKV